MSAKENINGQAVRTRSDKADSRFRHLSLDDLPPANTQRWVARRKAQVVAAVDQGLLTLDEACRRYHLTVEEFETWRITIERHGVRGLRVTRIQEYRTREPMSGFPPKSGDVTGHSSTH